MAVHSVRKAVLPLGGPNHASLPVQVLETQDGSKIPVLEYQIRTLLDAGIEEVALVLPASAPQIPGSLGKVFKGRVSACIQDKPAGFGHAVACARDWTAGEPFLVQVCDHMFFSRDSLSCAAQIIQVWMSRGSSVTALNRVNEREVPKLGLVVGRRLEGEERLYAVQEVLEKPSLTRAEQTPHVAGLRSNEYLCSSGLHVFTPLFMKILWKMQEAGQAEDLRWLDVAMAELMKHEVYLGMEIAGRRINLEEPYGLARAQIALALQSANPGVMMEILLEEVAALVPLGGRRANGR